MNAKTAKRLRKVSSECGLPVKIFKAAYKGGRTLRGGDHATVLRGLERAAAVFTDAERIQRASESATKSDRHDLDQ